MTNFNQFYSGNESQFCTIKQGSETLGNVYLGNTWIQSQNYGYPFTDNAIYDYDFAQGITATAAGWSGSKSGNGFATVNGTAATSSFGGGSYNFNNFGAEGLSGFLVADQSALTSSFSSSIYLPPNIQWSRTFQIWVSNSGSSWDTGRYVIACQNDAFQQGLNWFIHTRNTSGQLGWSFSGDTNNSTTIIATSSSAWQNIAFTIENISTTSANVKAYLNGVNVYSNTLNLYINATGVTVPYMKFGGRTDIAGNLAGNIGRVSIWNSILTPEQIFNNYISDVGKYQ